MHMDEATIYSEVTRFLSNEARLLDSRNFKEWLGLLTPDFEYRMRTRVVKEKAAGTALLEDDIIHDDRSFLELRVKRLDTEYAWAEDPPSRTRHLVTNIIVEPEHDEENSVRVWSNVLLCVSKLHATNYEMITYERHDVMKKIEGRWMLTSREIVPDQVTLELDSISYFF